MQLINYLQSHLRISPDVDLAQAITTQRFSKNHLLHREGSVCRKLFFIETGLARIFYYKDGKDITFSFVPENTFTTSADSFFQQKPSRYNIELLEQCVVSVIKYEDLMNLFEQSHEIERFGRKIITEFLNSFSDRLISLQFETAAERYQTLQVRYPNILSRVALGHIASYLGISQETLSRLRKKSSK